MFHQRTYVNQYIKDHYKTFKVRVNKNDAILLANLEAIDNVNQYVLSLIRADIERKRTYPFIDNSITIDFPLSKTMTELVNEAEKADILRDYGMYMNLADAIDSQAKKEVTHHELRESEWKKLTRRYHL